MSERVRRVSDGQSTEIRQQTESSMRISRQSAALRCCRHNWHTNTFQPPAHKLSTESSQSPTSPALSLRRLTTTTTTPQPFYNPFSGTTLVSWCHKRTSGLYGAREDWQRQTHRPSGWAPLHPNQPVPTSTISPDGSPVPLSLRLLSGTY